MLLFIHKTPPSFLLHLSFWGIWSHSLLRNFFYFSIFHSLRLNFPPSRVLLFLCSDFSPDHLPFVLQLLHFHYPSFILPRPFKILRLRNVSPASSLVKINTPKFWLCNSPTNIKDISSAFLSKYFSYKLEYFSTRLNLIWLAQTENSRDPREKPDDRRIMIFILLPAVSNIAYLMCTH